MTRSCKQNSSLLFLVFPLSLRDEAESNVFAGMKSSLEVFDTKDFCRQDSDDKVDEEESKILMYYISFKEWGGPQDILSERKRRRERNKCPGIVLYCIVTSRKFCPLNPTLFVTCTHPLYSKVLLSLKKSTCEVDVIGIYFFLLLVFQKRYFTSKSLSFLLRYLCLAFFVFSSLSLIYFSVLFLCVSLMKHP